MPDIDIFGKLKAQTQSGIVCDWNAVESKPYTIVDTLPDNLTSADTGKRFLLKSTGELYEWKDTFEVLNLSEGDTLPQVISFDTSKTPEFVNTDGLRMNTLLECVGNEGFDLFALLICGLETLEDFGIDLNGYTGEMGLVWTGRKAEDNKYSYNVDLFYVNITNATIEQANEILPTWYEAIAEAFGGGNGTINTPPTLTEYGWQKNSVDTGDFAGSEIVEILQFEQNLLATGETGIFKINELKVVSKLPTPTSTDIGNVFIVNTTGDMYAVEEQSPKPLRLSIGDTPPTTLYFDTSKTPDFSNEELLLQIGDAPYTEQGNSNNREISIGLVNFLPYYDVQAIVVEYNMITTSKAGVIYVQSTLSLEEVNALAQEEFGITVSHFGWQNNGVLEFNEYIEEDGSFHFEVQEFDNSQNLLVINQEPTIGYKKLSSSSSSSSKPEPLKVGDTFNMYDGIWFDNTREDILDILEGLSYDSGQCLLASIKTSTQEDTTDLIALKQEMSTNVYVYAIEFLPDTIFFVGTNATSSTTRNWVKDVFGGLGFLSASICLDIEMNFTVSYLNPKVDFIYKERIIGTYPDRKSSPLSRNAVSSNTMTTGVNTISCIINETEWDQNMATGEWEFEFYNSEYNASLASAVIVTPQPTTANIEAYSQAKMYLYEAREFDMNDGKYYFRRTTPPKDSGSITVQIILIS